MVKIKNGYGKNQVLGEMPKHFSMGREATQIDVMFFFFTH